MAFLVTADAAMMFQISLEDVVRERFFFAIPGKYLKNKGLLFFSGGIEVEDWLKMG